MQSSIIDPTTPNVHLGHTDHFHQPWMKSPLLDYDTPPQTPSPPNSTPTLTTAPTYTAPCGPTRASTPGARSSARSSGGRVPRRMRYGWVSRMDNFKLERARDRDVDVGFMSMACWRSGYVEGAPGGGESTARAAPRRRKTPIQRRRALMRWRQGIKGGMC